MQPGASSFFYILKSLTYTLVTMMIMVCALFLCDGELAYVAVVLGFVHCFGSISRMARIIRTTLKRYPASHKFSPNLGRIMSELCAAAGMPDGSIQLVDFNAAEHVVKDMNEKKKKYTPQYVLNAAAAYGADDFIMVSEPLLQLLEDDEEKAILGHELSHHLLRHTLLGAVGAYIGTITHYACLAILVPWMLRAGWQGMVAAVVAWGLVSIIFKILHPDAAELRTPQHPEMTAYDLVIRDRVKALHGFLTSLAFIAAISFFNHSYLLIYLLTSAFRLTNSLIRKSSARAQEFAADEGACMLKASPLALATALRKMKELEERSKKKAVQKSPDLPPPWWFRGLRHALFSTHPSTPRRVERLCAIARKLGYPEAAIVNAQQCPLTLPSDCEIPYDVIKHYLRQL